MENSKNCPVPQEHDVRGLIKLESYRLDEAYFWVFRGALIYDVKQTLLSVHHEDYTIVKAIFSANQAKRIHCLDCSNAFHTYNFVKYIISRNDFLESSITFF
jgi:hypothetical protein